MKNNKGFAGIGIIVAIIAISAAGSVAYYVGKSSNDSVPADVQENNYQPANQNQNKTQNSTSSDSNVESSLPFIAVLPSNNGYEWKSGQSQTIKWESSSLPDLIQGTKTYPVMINIGLLYQDASIENPDEYGSGRLCWLGSAPASTNSFSFTPKIGPCPSPNSSRPFLKEGIYKVVVYANYTGGYEGDSITSDESEDSFLLTK